MEMDTGANFSASWSLYSFLAMAAYKRQMVIKISRQITLQAITVEFSLLDNSPTTKECSLR